ncbi:c-type cytochrome [Candidatus Venteria ishoeyi]|uniref:Cytochrome c4 n=1 Tax=Candidatus Venteria ishoeyi TaxID=1899563 RepID=A0A1H6FBG4_9GAMM|nr:c-type cytochrome [Candidatus Venteria ishoeyi]MDM8547864.1 c-type cytochrome [Candidatus Venteria ishoeyi]SEH06364.1 Cytochrome c4 precursor [Candidatus Venteria ishoeyi]
MNKILQTFVIAPFLIALGTGLFFTSHIVMAWSISKEQQGIMHLEPNLKKGRNLFRTCAVCHAPTAWGTPDGHYPQIASQHQQVVIKQMLDIRSGNRDNPTMYPFTLKSVMKSDQDIANVSAYVASLPMSPYNEKGSGMDLQHGKALYDKHCTECHGDNGEGDNKSTFPRVHGQHYHYILRQLLWMQNGKRRNANDDMLKKIRTFNMRDLDAVSDYISRLPVADNLKAKQGWNNPDFSQNFRSRMPNQ